MRNSIEHELQAGRRDDMAGGGFYELSEADVGRPFLADPANGFGDVLGCDVGKRCYLFQRVFSMENVQQRDARKAKP